MSSWFERRRHRKILETPFPAAWLEILRRNMKHFAYLVPGEQALLRELTQLFVAEKSFEGCGGLELDDEVRVTIAGQACLLLLGLEHELYRNVETILVYPFTVVPKRAVEPMFAQPMVVESVMPLLGEAHGRGPVILTWDAAKRGGIHPELGHNVIYHEFAHKLDMLDGSVDGTPPLETPEEYRRWVDVCTREYELLRSRAERGEKTLLDPYAGTSTGEFFAVATECFFDQPLQLEQQQPELYAVLKAFYRQDPAERERRVARE